MVMPGRKKNAQIEPIEPLECKHLAKYSTHDITVAYRCYVINVTLGFVLFWKSLDLQRSGAILCESWISLTKWYRQ